MLHNQNIQSAFRAVSGYLSGCNLNWMTISISHSLHYRLVLIVHLSSLELHSSDLQNIDKFYVRINEMHKNSFKNNLYGHGTMVSKLVLQTITLIVYSFLIGCFNAYSILS